MVSSGYQKNALKKVRAKAYGKMPRVAAVNAEFELILTPTGLASLCRQLGQQHSPSARRWEVEQALKLMADALRQKHASSVKIQVFRRPSSLNDNGPFGVELEQYRHWQLARVKR